MRQGPDYGMWIGRHEKDGQPYLIIPLELEDEWNLYRSVLWHENGDGTITLYPSKD